MALAFALSKSSDASEIADLRNAAANDLTQRFGNGVWSGQCTERGVLFAQRNSKVYLARQRGKIVGTLALATKKPWAIDRSYFTPCARPLYLTAMAVLPALQHQGIGRQLLVHAREITQKFPAQAIYLDAYDAVAGAGEFYRACGFRETGRVVYRNVPLIYFEQLV